jgi:hypothetical protein
MRFYFSNVWIVTMCLNTSYVGYFNRYFEKKKPHSIQDGFDGRRGMSISPNSRANRRC